MHMEKAGVQCVKTKNKKLKIKPNNKIMQTIFIVHDGTKKKINK